MYATLRPSGDQRAALSCEPEDRVRFRTAPFWIGAEKTSPRPTNSARSPLGLRAKSSIKAGTTTTFDGRLARASVETVIGIGLVWPERVSRTCSSPPSS